MIETYLVAVVVGTAVETLAWAGRLWVYRRVINPVINVLVMFGVVMGALSLAVTTLGHLPVFLIGWAIGYGYEQLNFGVLDWWYFPADRFLLFKGRQACARSVGGLWGLVPLVVYQLDSTLF